ncbi:MAG: Gfo/Idh/MocA family oxidoreductase [Clostridiales bacterium]|nr:Gfo/Idh/MocA family oxidoreductase [Clostridiales bacterium]
MSKIKAAVIGTAHPHTPTLYKSIALRDDVEFIGCADVPPYEGVHGLIEGEPGVTGRMKQDFPQYKDLKVYADWRELADLRPHVAIVGADNAAHAEAVCYLLSLGVLPVIEKPMAYRFSEAEAMYRAYRRYGVPFITNWPVTWFPAFRLAKKLNDEGKAGRPLRFIYRSPATLGPYSYGGSYTNDFLASSWWYQKDRGGGSVMDYACYGCMLSTWFYGVQAKTATAFVTSFGTSYSDVPDFSQVTLDFGGKIAQLEGSWSTIGNGGVPTGPIVYGDSGVLVCDRSTSDVKIFTGLRAKEPTAVFAPEPFADSLGSNIIDALNTGVIREETLTPEFNLKAFAALSSAAEAGEEKRTVAVHDCAPIINTNIM